jgi:formate--tetrahydrofolate ligase
MSMIEKIENIVAKLNIPLEYIEYYGKYKAKISDEYYDKIKDRKNGKLILVTAINPTSQGEGKTTQSIGISMAMNKIGKNSIAVLREPSLGPVFGVKGGAVGGGMSKIIPSQDIDLHFTGDFHAITSANNLLCAVLDNHIFQGNKLNINPEKICIKRAIDMNDRSLRSINILEGRKTGFEITAACEIMAICCLAENKVDLKNRLENILVAYNFDNNPVYARELKVVNAMMALLQEAMKPNLVQTIENTPCIVHLGPFANIAHGCNSVISTKLGLKLADYCITEAGFGADLGAEKFLDIKCRTLKIIPDVVVIVATVRALKYNSSEVVEDLSKENMHLLEKGIVNLEKHIENMKKYGIPVIVCINKFESDTKNEIDFIKKFCLKMEVKCETSTSYTDGSEGAINIAKLIAEVLEENKKNNFKYIYEDEDDIKVKIEKVCKEIYGAGSIEYLENATKEIESIRNFGYNKLPICIAKTPLSFSDDPKLLGRPKDFNMVIRDIKIESGAGFIVVYAGNIMTMPGLGKNSKYEEF